MSEDSFTEVSHESWFSRIKGAIFGVFFGLILVAVAFPLLFWNEGRSVKRYKTLKEGGGAVVSVVPDWVVAANEGKLIHVAGRAETDDTLTDPVFGVSANALKLKRVVEMYQWDEDSHSETKKKLGGGTETVTTYTYSREWADHVISSSSFKESTGHQNPGYMPYESTQQVAEKVTLGAFTLSPSLVGGINNFEILPMKSDTPLPESLKDNARLHGTGLYIGADPSSPKVGDTRIDFKYAPPTEVSVIAGQTGNTFKPYRTNAGGTIELLQAGAHSAETMIEKAQQSNKIVTWGLRLAGFLIMFFGFAMLFRPLSVVADVLPILGTIVGAGTGLISFLLAGVLSLLTIGVAWIVYRPVLGAVLIAVAIGLAVVITGKLKSARASTPA